MAAKKAAEKRGPGRPSLYTEELAERICDLIAEDWSLRQIGARDDMPDFATIVRWCGKNEDFAAKCARAREAQADFVVGQAADLETKVLSGEVPSDAARVVLSSRQWRASKLAPKRYGDKQTIAHEGEVGVKHSGLTPAERIAKLAEMAKAHPELLAKLSN